MKTITGSIISFRNRIDSIQVDIEESNLFNHFIQFEDVNLHNIRIKNAKDRVVLWVKLDDEIDLSFSTNTVESKMKEAIDLLEFLLSIEYIDTNYLVGINIQNGSLGYSDGDNAGSARINLERVNAKTFNAENYSKYIGCLNNMNDNTRFALSLYDCFVRAKDTRSQFCVLFPIIEMIEKEYACYNQSTRRYRDEEIAQLEKPCERIAPNLYSDIKGSITRLTDLGRYKCLLNILKHMSADYLDYEKKNKLGIQDIREILNTRNKLYHGSDQKELSKSVMKLRIICIHVIEYLLLNDIGYCE